MAVETVSFIPSIILESNSVFGIFKLATILPKYSLKISETLFSSVIISSLSTNVTFSLLIVLSEKDGLITFQNNLLSVTDLGYRLLQKALFVF